MSRRSVVKQPVFSETIEPTVSVISTQEEPEILSCEELRMKALHDCGVALTYITKRLSRGSTADHPLIGQTEKAIQMVGEYNNLIMQSRVIKETSVN